MGFIRLLELAGCFDDQVQFFYQRIAGWAVHQMGTLFYRARVFHFRQAVLQLNAIHTNLSPSRPRLKLPTQLLTPLIT
jgi:hypothetical protein